MHNRRFAGRLAAAVVLLSIFAFSGGVLAAEFTADLVVTTPKSSYTFKLYVKGMEYRLDKMEGEDKVSFVLARKPYRRLAFSQKHKEYKELGQNEAIFFSPLLAWEHVQNSLTGKPAGSETIDGYQCDRFKFSRPKESKTVLMVWNSKKLQFKIKQVMYADNGDATMEVKNIVEGPVDAALFQVPAGYAKAKGPERKAKKPPPPGITTTVKGSAPWARRISPGGEMRVATSPDESVRVRVENMIKGESVARVTAMRKGRVIGTEMGTDTDQTIVLKRYKGEYKELLIGLQHKTDEVVIRVEKGMVLARVKREPLSFRKPAVKDYYLMHHEKHLTVDPARELRLTVTGDSQDSAESKIKIVFYKGQYTDELSAAEPVLKNGQSKSWEFHAGHPVRSLKIAVLKPAAARVRIEQPEPKKKAAPKVVSARPAAQGPFRLTKQTKRDLGLAIQKNDIKGVEAFLDNGLDVNAQLSRDGSDVLMKAANIGTVEMVKMLLKRGADVKSVTKYGYTALLRGLDNYKQWLDIGTALIHAGSDVNAKIKRDGYTPLWKAIGKTPKRGSRAGAIGLIKLLLARGAKVNAPMISKNPKFDGYTPLMNASAKGYAQVVKLLLERGADVNAKTKAGKGALDFARAKGHREVADLLVAKGAK